MRGVMQIDGARRRRRAFVSLVAALAFSLLGVLHVHEGHAHHHAGAAHHGSCHLDVFGAPPADEEEGARFEGASLLDPSHDAPHHCPACWLKTLAAAGAGASPAPEEGIEAPSLEALASLATSRALAPFEARGPPLRLS